MSVSPSVPAELAALLPEFELLRELGRGGAAIVYLARDRELGREVAVKVVRERFLDDTETSARFAREARTAARLQHPNIVAVHGARRLANGALALVMQHVPGCTLKHLIREQGPLPFARVERVLGEVAAALEHAHRHGVIHRDIKPENIYLHAESGRALLADFGIAKPLDGENSLTLNGTVIGTPAYMSPEQVDGREVDGRSDLYSLGLVGYEMITGRRPWEGENLYSIIYKQKHEELPPLERLRPGTPSALRAALEGALKKEREQRWNSVAEFAAQLAPASEGEEMAGAPDEALAPLPTLAPRAEEEEEAHTIRYRKPAPGPARAETPPQAPVVAPAPRFAAAPIAAPRPADSAPGELVAVVERVEQALRSGPARRVPRRRSPWRRGVGAALVLVLGAGATLLARPGWEPRAPEASTFVPTPHSYGEPPARPAPGPAPAATTLDASVASTEATVTTPTPPEKRLPEPESKSASKETPAPAAKPTPASAPKQIAQAAPRKRRDAELASSTPAPRNRESAPPRLTLPRAEVQLAGGADPASAPSLARVEMTPRPRNRGAVESALAAALTEAERGAASGISLWVLVDEAGRTRDARVSGSSGSAAVDAAALRAARRLEFAPAAGQASPVWVSVALRLPGS
jgi:TonB family protein